MRQIKGYFFLALMFFASIVFAQESYQAETIVGIGAGLEKTVDGAVRIVALISNAPAERAGLEVGDIIMEVKSTPSSPFVDVRMLPLLDIVALIRGPIGVPVEIVIVRGGLAPTVVSIVRDKVEVSDTN